MVNKKSTPAKIIEEEQMLETDVSKEFLNFFIDKLRDLYWAEKHLTKTLPKMQRAATSSSLKDTFSGHLAFTQLHVERLEQVFELLGETPRAKKCEAMGSLAEEAVSVIEETQKGSQLRDVGLVLAAQKVEHYEIAAYGGMVQLARTMGNEDIISLLEETLGEEIKADDLLTIFAEAAISSSLATGAMETKKEDSETIAEVYDSINLTGKNIKKI